jgi:hypothetical protein
METVVRPGRFARAALCRGIAALDLHIHAECAIPGILCGSRIAYIPQIGLFKRVPHLDLDRVAFDCQLIVVPGDP